MKPSYEDLEEQLNISRRLCDAALANERVWETAMMQACGEDGPKSVAEKFAALEARCAALAAENAGLKNALEWLYETVSSESVSIPDEKYSSVTNAAQVLSETTTTDAFLAEVRAQGVEMFANAQNKIADDEAVKGNVDLSLRYRGMSLAADTFASQLRKGVQS
ncbi:hypothetical protein [Enterobacter hormaechei]|uniref:hypothetical protein n=1 Tax=Enterobacter hormaechei TaxID=158836 RepID=UPI00345CED93